MLAGQPSQSMIFTAMRRAAHQLLDRPRLVEDPVAVGLIPEASEHVVLGALDEQRAPLSTLLRALFAFRSRFAEDRLAEAAFRGVRQYVVVGAGLDTFAWRQPSSEADTAVWLPNERVLFSASACVVNQINILRPFVTIPDILAAGKMMKTLNPEHVVPGHGTPGTVKIFEDGEMYYTLLLDRVGAMVKAGKSLDDIKKEVKMPEYASWGSQDRFPTNVEAAYKAVVGK